MEPVGLMSECVQVRVPRSGHRQCAQGCGLLEIALELGDGERVSLEIGLPTTTTTTTESAIKCCCIAIVRDLATEVSTRSRGHMELQFGATSNRRAYKLASRVAHSPQGSRARAQVRRQRGSGRQRRCARSAGRKRDAQ